MTAGGQGVGRVAADSPSVSRVDQVRRMERIARAQGVDLGELRAGSGSDSDVEVDADRGRVVVSPGAEGRIHVRICLHRVFAWSEGWTNELAAAVGIADLWRRGGSLRELCDRFPFMSWSELAQAFEDGDPAPVRWRQLLTGEWHVGDRPFLRAAHAHSDLRLFYPDLSRGSLMLSRKPFDPASGLAKITPVSGSLCRVAVWPVGFRRDVSLLDEAFDVAAACFRSLPDA